MRTLWRDSLTGGWRRSASTLSRRARDTALIAVVLLGVALAGVARADGDPASDVLLTQNAFYPYQPAPTRRLEAVLNTVLGRAARAGMPLKVAIVGSREDLGAVPTFFGHPQQYAAFLDREISYNARTPQPLLVVMPAGFGLAALAPASALAHVNIDAGARTAGLTSAAILAVGALARANGHAIAAVAIPASAGPTTTKRSASPNAILFALPVLLLLVAGAVLRRRRRDPAARASGRGDR